MSSGELIDQGLAGGIFDRSVGLCQKVLVRCSIVVDLVDRP